MILDDISEALKGVNGPVFYGTAASLPKKDPWDYTVFSRADVTANAHLTSRSAAFEVAIVHEDYIPDGVIDGAIDAMAEIAGMNLAQGSSIKYVYSVKPGTETTVEMAVLSFNRSSKAMRGARR